MKTTATLMHFGVGSLKVRRFGSTIKGEPVKRAQAILALQASPTCQALLKLLNSAIANAENNNGLAAENLIVSNVTADQGPTMKRIRPRARGRAFRILKRSSHVTIELDLKPGLESDEVRDDQEEQTKTPAEKAPAKKKVTTKKAAEKKPGAKKPAAKKTPAKKPAAKKTPAKKDAAKKAPAKKAAAKKESTGKDDAGSKE